MGRPFRTLDSLPDNWENDVIEMMTEGASINEVKALLKVGNSTFDRLRKDEDKFKKVINEGLRQSRAWWEKLGRENVHNKAFNSTLWYMNMKNRFQWKDRQDVTSDDEKIQGVNIYKPTVKSDEK